MDLNFTGTQTIQTERLTLRRFETGDAEAMYRNWAFDEAVTKYMHWNAHKNVDETSHILSSWVDDYLDALTYNWAIVLKELGEPVGSISLLNLNTVHSKAEAGYCMGKAWWGRGIMTEALKAVIAYGFDVVGLNRVEAVHQSENIGSGMVMQKAGMVHEGHMRQWRYIKGMFRDYEYYGILIGEYNKAKSS